MPYLKEIRFDWSKTNTLKEYPFNIPSISKIKHIRFNKNVTFFVGENGSGKSTLLEAIAYHCGFNVEGGNRNTNFSTTNSDNGFHRIMKLVWFPKITNGFFLRAESFYDYASYLDQLQKEDPRALDSYGGKSLHEQSHGESFFALFHHRLGKQNFLIFDEPEAALSPLRQLAFIRFLWDLEMEKKCQILVATHSPIILAYPNSEIWTLDESLMKKISYKDTQHYQLTKRFLNTPQEILNQLLNND